VRATRIEGRAIREQSARREVTTDDALIFATTLADEVLASTIICSNVCSWGCPSSLSDRKKVCLTTRHDGCDLQTELPVQPQTTCGGCRLQPAMRFVVRPSSRGRHPRPYLGRPPVGPRPFPTLYLSHRNTVFRVTVLVAVAIRSSPFSPMLPPSHSRANTISNV